MLWCSAYRRVHDMYVCVAVCLVGGGGSPPPGSWPCMLSPAGWLPRVRDQLRAPTLEWVWVPLPLPFTAKWVPQDHRGRQWTKNHPEDIGREKHERSEHTSLYFVLFVPVSCCKSLIFSSTENSVHTIQGYHSQGRRKSRIFQTKLQTTYREQIHIY